MDTIRVLVEKFGYEAVYTKLREFRDSENTQSELTIITNQALHSIAEDYLLGHVYVASEGNLPLNSQDAIEQAITSILGRLKVKLNERTWTRIYMHFTGPQVLGAAIKHFVYRATGLETVDFVYHEGHYYPVALDYRNIK